MRERPSGRSVAMPALSSQSRALGVTQGDADAGAISPFSSNSRERAPLRVLRPPSTSATVGVGHRDPVEALADVGGVHGRSRDIDRPAGVIFTSQISGDSVEPIEASLSRNLLSNDDSGPAGTDEAKHVGPQMPWIVSPGAFAGLRERLTGAGARPKRSVVGPAGKAGGDRPEPTSGEQVDLGEASHVIRPDLLNGAGVHDAGSNHAVDDQFAQHRAGGGVDLVVEGAAHGRARSVETRASKQNPRASFVVPPHVSHFRQVPLRTIVRLPQSGQALPV